jgi:hypothetical protein
MLKKPEVPQQEMELVTMVVSSPFLAVCQSRFRLADFQRSSYRLHPEVLRDFS